MAKERRDADRRSRQCAKFARLIRVARLVTGNGRWGPEDLARELECSQRTVFRDIEILSVAGIPVFFDKAVQAYRVPDKSLSEELDRVVGLQQPLTAKTDAAAAFLSTWAGVGNLLSEVSEEEKQQILQNYVEVIEFRKTDDCGKVGVYAIQFFPEIRQYFDPGDTDGDVPASTPPKSPKTPSGATSPEEGGPAELTPEDAVVCTGVRLAPRTKHFANQFILHTLRVFFAGFTKRWKS